MSAASARLAPYFKGMEKIRFSYLSISADQARSSPSRHARTSRSSLHAASGAPLSWRPNAPPLTPEWLRDGVHHRPDRRAPVRQSLKDGPFLGGLRERLVIQQKPAGTRIFGKNLPPIF